jgi:hypothetical protein
MEVQEMIKCVKCHEEAEYVLHGISVCKPCMDGFVEKAAAANSPIIKPGG